jgi:hypothetical protein
MLMDGRDGADKTKRKVTFYNLKRLGNEGEDGKRESQT